MAKRIAIVAALITCIAATAGHGETTRRIGAGLKFDYFMLDSGYFGLEDGMALNLALQYELGWNVFFETAIGGLRTEGGGVKVKGLLYNVGCVAVIPVLIPYRPFARFGIGVQSVNPLTATPVDTYRPTQTTIYLNLGAGFTRSIRENFLVEIGGGMWFTPYKYRVYTFDRSSVTSDDRQFTHFNVSLGLSYIF
jgi:hypothetical protein